MDVPRPAPFVRVVVLNWNAAWLTARCVRSLQASTYPADRFEIVVVDNASIDGSFERLRADLSGVRFVANERNAGFAEGNNRAMRDLDDCDFVALINNDAVVEPDWLEPLVEALLADGRRGAAAPKMLLEARFSPLRLTGRADGITVAVDGVDVTRRCVFEGVIDRAHPTVPLAVDRSIDGAAAIHVPVGGSDSEITVSWTDGPGLRLVEADGADPDGARSDGAERDGTAGDGPAVTSSTTTSLTIDPGRRRDVRINSLGTELTPWTEGFERWFGALDRPHLATHDVWGFSGGGVLLRSEMLEAVGLFEPRFFAYYEDTDLAWRARRAGWSVVCVPASVVHHLHGGSAGPEAQGFFFLNYRNWLLTVMRNGSPRQVLRALGTASHLSWPAFRRNVFGLLRRGRRPQAAISVAWGRVAVGVLGSAPAVLAARLPGRMRRTIVGHSPSDVVSSRLMPATPPRAPRNRPLGPRLVYVDVTETLRSGWRAGIQRVVCEIVRNLPEADHDIELVAVCWSKVHDRFRRIDPVEYASLLSPTAAQQPAAPAPAPTRARKVLATTMHRSGAAPFVYRLRRRRELDAVPAHHRALLLDRLEPGSVFLDVDASWNPTTVDRRDLLPRLRDGDVRTMTVVYDLFPHSHPHWFIPQMVDVFMEHLDAHLDADSEFLCISRHTRDELLAYAGGRPSAGPPGTAVVPMGATPVALGPGLPDEVEPFFLAVGTIEPRKDHGTILDAFEKVRAQHPDARLVVVGRAGWSNDDVIERLRSGPAGVDWRTNVSDDELDLLYRTCLAVVVASVTEGYGLPVIEALQRGVPVLSSTGGSLPEAGGDDVEYFEPGSSAQLHDLMVRHLGDTDHHRARREVAGRYDAPTWADTARAVATAIHHETGR